MTPIQLIATIDDNVLYHGYSEMTGEPTSALQAATLTVAVLGAVLGIINTWNAVSQRQLRLQLRPAHAISANAYAFSIEVVNQSSFAVTIDEVGFLLGRARGRPNSCLR